MPAQSLIRAGDPSGAGGVAPLGSQTLKVNGVPAIRKGDLYTLPDGTQAPAQGSSLSVSMDKGLGAHRSGDLLADGSPSGVGSLTVKAR